MAYIKKIRDADSYLERLERFLSDRCLLFNPYSVSDRSLWDGIMKMRWRGDFSLTQMVFLKFLGIKTDGTGFWTQKHVIFSIGDSSDEVTRRMEYFTSKRTAADSLRQVRNTINGRPVTKEDQIHRLIGKTVFVSRIITTHTLRDGYAAAMAMHTLRRPLTTAAATIRKAIISSKIEMLDRLLANPEAHIYLDGVPSRPVDIATPINSLKAIINTYLNTPVPD